MLIIVQTKMFSSRTEKVENKEYFGNNSPWTHRTEKKQKQTVEPVLKIY